MRVGSLRTAWSSLETPVLWDGVWGPHRACLTSSFPPPPTEEHPLIAGNNLVFSSYPGTIFSGDDFYILGSGLVSGQVTCSLGIQHTGSGDAVKDEVCGTSEPLSWRLCKALKCSGLGLFF